MVLNGTRNAVVAPRILTHMHSRFASFVLITILAVVITPFAVRGTAREADQGKTQAPAKKESNKKTEQGSALTGCVDQQDGQYVLVDERNREAIADLIAEGFPTEGFAKHVGHKVTIRGTSSTGGTRTVMKVRSIETVSETCGPQEAGKH
ncbi:MAG: hypothetical protein JWP63_2120 [Candidatus Solibacter sp.]|jgi:hypothetical protein|nr:hypothetical protein [Candidatus Solibacter sp.]